MMQISIFTDEINPDAPGRALDIAKNWGVGHVEIRSLPNGRFPAVPDDELEDLRAMIDGSGLLVSGVSPGYCKCSWEDPSVENVLSDELPRCCEWARRFGTDIISCFAFDKDGDNSATIPSAIVDLMGKMSSVAERNGCRLVLENEAGCWGGTGIEAAEIIRKVASENFTLCWDPGNSCMAGAECPYPGEYNQFKDLVSHVHMKNFDRKSNSWSLLDNGMVDWAGQIEALSADGYEGFLVIETHLHISPDEFRVIDKDWSGLENNTEHNLRFVRECLGGRAG